MTTGLDGRIVAVCGSKDTGKTTVVEGLVRFLKATGASVGTLKHVHGELAADPAAKDSSRHLAAGADCAVAVAERSTQVLVADGAPEPGAGAGAGAGSEMLERAAARYLGLCDYIVVEGFKHAGLPKIVVTRRAEDIPPGLGHVIAYIYWDSKPAGLPVGVPAFKPDEIEKLGSFLFEGRILAPPGPTAQLVVNGKPVPMNEFVGQALSGVLKGFIGTLRDVEPPKTIEISVKFP
jgi:molybdopterin-guanine dinucleotide biosynthesis protein MobB